MELITFLGTNKIHQQLSFPYCKVIEFKLIWSISTFLHRQGAFPVTASGRIAQRVQFKFGPKTQKAVENVCSSANRVPCCPDDGGGARRGARGVAGNDGDAFIMSSRRESDRPRARGDMGGAMQRALLQFLLRVWWKTKQQ